MKKFLLQLALAFICLVSSIYLGYLYLNSLDNTANPLLFVVATFLLVIGVFFIFRAGKIEYAFVSQPKEQIKDPSDTKKSIFETNNELVSNWRKTEEQKTRLRLLKLAGEMNNE